MDPIESKQQKDGTFQYLLTIGIVAMEGRGFEYPIDTLPSKNGVIYVTNKSRNEGVRGVRISMLNLKSEYFGEFGLFGDQDGLLTSPSGIAEDQNGNVLVLDEALNRLTTYNQDGTFINKWEPSTDSGYCLSGPSSLTVDSNADVFVSDTGNHRIVKFDKNGLVMSSFGGEGSAPGKFKYPWGITTDNHNNIYVSDWGNDRIQLFSSDGIYVRSYKGTIHNNYNLNHPSSVQIDPNGNLIIADWGNESIKIVSSDDHLIQELRGEATLSVWAQEFMDSNREEYDARKTSNLDRLAVEGDGSSRHTISAHVEKYFWGPTSVKLDSNSRLYVTDSNRHRIQIYEWIST